MSVGIVAVESRAAPGCIFGVIAGYFGGVVDWAVSRLIEAMMCFPAFFLILQYTRLSVRRSTTS